MKKIKLIKNYFISDILKKSATTKSELEFLAKKLNIPNIKIEWLKDADPNYKGPRIINLGNNIIGGTHWVATYNNIYFDSFGLPPPPQFENYEWIPLDIQDINYGGCGQYSVLFLYYAIENELDQFYNLFSII